ncbi:2TM domain-containing protein [Dyadobacter sp. CY312]|uniref:2TM domain-containing protein n=1 Tax=Dyadobacter sp. CY312 TaxID=2907303 RepID=UPI001F1BF56B|nr:2TM domain-containing protein [Dyadobacter sp. CY312]MCE7039946.1 2TM domain-containing protein [Dyadobacter sp. CY312]
METPRNEQLWKKAQKRASFKIHLRSYFIVNGGLWIIYFLSTGMNWGNHGFPWPVWPMLGWGIGLASHYFSAYGNNDEMNLAQKEYEKLLREQR